MDGAKTTQDEPESSSREPEPPGGATSPSDIIDNRPPLLMQRPPSSGIDITGFSFAKPVSHSLGFSLSGGPKQGRIDPASLGAAIRGMTTSAGPESLKELFQSR